MKNIRLLTVLVLLTGFCFNLNAQPKPEKISVNGKSLFRKSCETNVAKGPVKCILCDDQKLQTNCKEYLKDAKGSYSIITTSSKTNTVLKTKKPTKPIKGDPDDGGEVTKK